MRATVQEFMERYGALAKGAVAEPVTITDQGEDQFVLVSIEEYDRMRRQGRRARLSVDLEEREALLIATAAIPPECDGYNDELDRAGL